MLRGKCRPCRFVISAPGMATSQSSAHSSTNACATEKSLLWSIGTSKTAKMSVSTGRPMSSLSASCSGRLEAGPRATLAAGRSRARARPAPPRSTPALTQGRHREEHELQVGERAHDPVQRRDQDDERDAAR